MARYRMEEDRDPWDNVPKTIDIMVKIIHETEKAWKVSVLEKRGVTDFTFFLPKSRCSIVSTKDTGSMIRVPKWLFDKIISEKAGEMTK